MYVLDIVSLQQEDGSFIGDIWGEVDTRFSYCALNCCALLGQLQKLNVQSNYLVDVQPRGKAAISDHYFFTYNGVPSFFIYTLGGIKAYHDIYDRAETLPLTKFEEVYNLLINFESYLEK